MLFSADLHYKKCQSKHSLGAKGKDISLKLKFKEKNIGKGKSLGKTSST